MLKLIVLCLILLLSGCQALQEKAGNMIKDAVVNKVSTVVDNKLATKGTSLAEIKGTVDSNNDGILTSPEILAAVKDYSKEFVLLEAHDFLQQKIQDKQLMSKKDLDASKSSIWTYLVTGLSTLMVGYLSKQLYAARADASRDAKIAVLEKVLKK